MRDETTRNVTIPNYWYRNNSPGTVFTRTGTHRAERRYRSDIVKTAWIPHKGFRYPTAYQAFFGTCLPFAFNYQFLYLGSQPATAFGTSNASHFGGPNIWYHGCVNQTYPVPNLPFNLRNQAQQEALAKLKQGDFSAGIFLGEGGRTLRTVSSAARAVLMALAAVRSGKFLSALKHLRINPRSFGKDLWRRLKRYSPADFWLSIQYGWKPLMADIYNAIEALKMSWNQFPPIVTVKRNVSMELGAPSIPSNFAPEFKGSCEVGCQVKLAYRVTSPWLYALNSLGLINPLEIAWELKTLSFVVDWFVPIGTFLSNFSSSVGIEYAYGYRTEWAKANFVVKCASNGNFVGGTKESVAVKHLCMNRVPLYALPPPVPYIKVRYNETKLVTSVALLIQRSR